MIGNKKVLIKLNQIIEQTKESYEEKVCKLIWNFNLYQDDKMLFEIKYHDGLVKFKLYRQSENNTNDIIFYTCPIDSRETNFKQLYEFLVEAPYFSIYKNK